MKQTNRTPPLDEVIIEAIVAIALTYFLWTPVYNFFSGIIDSLF